MTTAVLVVALAFAASVGPIRAWRHRVPVTVATRADTLQVDTIRVDTIVLPPLCTVAPKAVPCTPSIAGRR